MLSIVIMLHFQIKDKCLWALRVVTVRQNSFCNEQM